MVVDLLVIGTMITLGPLHNTAFILLLTADKGVRKGLAFILAWLACLVLVIAVVVLLTGGQPPAPRSAPSTAAEAVKLALGVGMVLYGEHRRRQGRQGSRHRESPKWMSRLDHVSAWTAAGFGVLLPPWAMVAAGAATVVQANLSSVGAYLALTGYCLLATSSLLGMELYATFAPTTAGPQLSRVRTWINGHQDQAIVALSLMLGLWLAGKSIYELVR
ncbi:hypothetical protein ABIA33_002281 [Streptacidiphilus sp. MAP12-16]|uniref:GAP family protein n=1 Tax=Streptacidiphilus sp. MAP12-16 TaxID=3156300 RepID=UPI0035131786